MSGEPFLKPVPTSTPCMLTNRRQEVIISDENGRMAKEGATALFCLFVCKAARGFVIFRTERRNEKARNFEKNKAVSF